jgi:hypothetical protein
MYCSADAIIFEYYKASGGLCTISEEAVAYFESWMAKFIDLF